MMNREQRRRMVKNEKRNSNSKKSFRVGDVEEISVYKLAHNENLKECDEELLDLMKRVYDWKIKNVMSKLIINTALNYLDVLCSLRFDITPDDDRKLVGDAMRWISDMVVLFISLYEQQAERTLNELYSEAVKNGENTIQMKIAKHKDIAPYYGDVVNLPSSDDIDDMYADFVVSYANKLAQVLCNVRYSDVLADEQYVLEVLLLIGKKTVQLLPKCNVV